MGFDQGMHRSSVPARCPLRKGEAGDGRRVAPLDLEDTHGATPLKCLPPKGEPDARLPPYPVVRDWLQMAAAGPSVPLVGDPLSPTEAHPSFDRHRGATKRIVRPELPPGEPKAAVLQE